MAASLEADWAAMSVLSMAAQMVSTKAVYSADPKAV